MKLMSEPKVLLVALYELSTLLKQNCWQWEMFYEILREKFREYDDQEFNQHLKGEEGSNVKGV